MCRCESIVRETRVMQTAYTVLILLMLVGISRLLGRVIPLPLPLVQKQLPKALTQRRCSLENIFHSHMPRYALALACVALHA